MSSAAPPAKLTKKQQKAQLFKQNKSKAKALEDQLEVPEAEDLDSAEAAEPEVAAKVSKRKRAAEDESEASGAKNAGHDGEAEVVTEAGAENDTGERKKKRQRGKKKSLHNPSKTADGQPRFILFVGTSSPLSSGLCDPPRPYC